MLTRLPASRQRLLQDMIGLGQVAPRFAPSSEELIHCMAHDGRDRRQRFLRERRQRSQLPIGQPNHRSLHAAIVAYSPLRIDRHSVLSVAYGSY